MRQERTVQVSIFGVFAAHEIGYELKAMSRWLDEHRDLLGLVTRDLAKIGVTATGRQGLPAEAVLRCALLKQYRQLSYQELAFHLEDSASFRAFARLPRNGGFAILYPLDVGGGSGETLFTGFARAGGFGGWGGRDAAG